MIRRLAGAAVLASVTALVLAGCSPSEPTEPTREPSTPTASSTVIEPSEARAAYEAYATAVQEMYEAQDAQPTHLEGVATPAAATDAAADVRATLEAGFLPTIPPAIRSFDLTHASETTARAELCLDASSAEIVHIETGEPARRTTDPLTDWRVEFEREESTLLVSSYESISQTEASACE